MNDAIHKTVVVTKPWGYEYLAYQNESVALWVLHINQNEKTSLHCHPNKSTGLVVLNGIAEINFIADNRILEGPAKQMIRRGLFHQTTALSKGGVDLFEIETPVDKNDLVRLKDTYGRSEIGYEKEEYSIPKTEECLWLFPDDTVQMFEKFNCNITLEKTTSGSSLYSKNDDDIIVFLSGGLFKVVEGRQHNVVIPGDVGYAKIVKQVAEQMTGLVNNTILLTIKNDKSK